MIEIAIAVAGFTPGEADRLRRVMTHARSQRVMEEIGQQDVYKRQLQAGSQEEQFLRHVLEGLSKTIMARYDTDYQISGLTIILDQLTPLSWCQPDLFSYRSISSAEEKPRLDHALMRLENRFPGFLTRGVAIARREQVPVSYTHLRDPAKPSAHPLS